MEYPRNVHGHAQRVAVANQFCSYKNVFVLGKKKFVNRNFGAQRFPLKRGEILVKVQRCDIVHVDTLDPKICLAVKV